MRLFLSILAQSLAILLVAAYPQASDTSTGSPSLVARQDTDSQIVASYARQGLCMYYIGNQQNKTQELLSCTEYCSTQNSSDATGVCHTMLHPTPYPNVALFATTSTDIFLQFQVQGAYCSYIRSRPKHHLRGPKWVRIHTRYMLLQRWACYGIVRYHSRGTVKARQCDLRGDGLGFRVRRRIRIGFDTRGMGRKGRQDGCGGRNQSRGQRSQGKLLSLICCVFLKHATRLI